jgi:uncharacterized protein YPO0396
MVLIRVTSKPIEEPSMEDVERLIYEPRRKLMKRLQEEYDKLQEERERLTQMLREARTQSERASILGRLSAVSRKQEDIVDVVRGLTVMRGWIYKSRERVFKVPTPAQAKAQLEGGERLARLRRKQKGIWVRINPEESSKEAAWTERRLSSGAPG